MDVSAVSEELAELEGQINDIFRALSSDSLFSSFPFVHLLFFLFLKIVFFFGDQKWIPEAGEDQRC